MCETCHENVLQLAVKIINDTEAASGTFLVKRVKKQDY